MTKIADVHRLAFEHSDRGLAVLSLEDARFVDANDRFCEFVGRSHDDIVGSEWPLIVGIDDPDLIKSKVEAYAAEVGGSLCCELYVRVKLASEQNDGFVLISVQEMRDRRAAELKAKLQAEQLEALLDAVPAGIWISHDPSCKHVSANQVARDWIQMPVKAPKFLSTNTSMQGHSYAGALDADGKLLDAAMLPIFRACKGERVDNFEAQIVLEDGQKRYMFGNARPLFDAKGESIGAVSAFIDITDRKRAEVREHLLAREVDHRARNILSVIQAMVQLSKAANVEAFKSLIAGRIGSLARAHTLLSDSRWQGVDFRSLIQEELKPFGFDDPNAEDLQRFSITGPDIALTPAAAQSLALVVHELATNASKYGSLSDPNGKLRIDWGFVEDRPEIFNFSWWEFNGRAVVPPDQSGFGATVIRTSVEDQLHGQILSSWLDEGMKVEISCPIAEVTDTPPPPTLPVEPLRYDLLQRLIRFYHF